MATSVARANINDGALPMPQPPISKADVYLRRNREFLAAHPTDAFPSGGSGSTMVYTRDLLGMPFVVCSEWGYAHQAPRTVTTQDGRVYNFGAQDVVQVYVARLLYDESGEWTIDVPELATLTGAYLVNQFRSLTPGQVVGAGVFTIAENPALQTKGGTHPKMLKIYDPETDGLPVDDSPFASDAVTAPTAEQMEAQAAALGLSFAKPTRTTPVTKARH